MLSSSSRRDGVAVTELAVVVQDVRLVGVGFSPLLILQFDLVVSQGVAVVERLLAVNAFVLDVVVAAGSTGWCETHAKGARSNEIVRVEWC